jgi:hypothetical protein
MAIVLGGVLLVVIVVVAMHLRRRQDAADLGWMGTKWLEQERASRIH